MSSLEVDDAVEVGITALIPHHHRLSESDLTATLAGEGTGDDIGSTGPASGADGRIQVLDEVIREPHRDLSGHPTMVPIWDAAEPVSLARVRVAPRPRRGHP